MKWKEDTEMLSGEKLTDAAMGWETRGVSEARG